MTDLLHPFDIYREHKKAICWAALIIAIAVNVAYIGISNYVDYRNRKIEDDIQDIAINEVKKLNEYYQQNDPGFPGVQLDKVFATYDNYDRSVDISILFNKNITKDIMEEYARSVSSRVFNKIAEKHLKTIEVICTRYLDITDTDFKTHTLPMSEDYTFTRKDF